MAVRRQIMGDYSRRKLPPFVGPMEIRDNPSKLTYNYVDSAYLQLLLTGINFCAYFVRFICITRKEN